MTSSLIFTEAYHLFWHLILSALYYPYLGFSLVTATHKINSLKYYWNLLPVLNAEVVKFYLNINYRSFKKKCTITLQSKYKEICTFLLLESIKDHRSAFKGLLHCTILKKCGHHKTRCFKVAFLTWILKAPVAHKKQCFRTQISLPLSKAKAFWCQIPHWLDFPITLDIQS